MYYHNQPYARVVIACIYLMLLINIADLCFSLSDIPYLKKLILEVDVPQGAHDFFIKKNNMLHWASIVGHVSYVIAFLTWFYRTYKNVYVRESEQAPYKPGLVPFSYIIPFFNLFGPHKIMKFIWWGNAESIDDMQKGYKAVLVWWTFSVITFLYGRIISTAYADITYAADFLQSTYAYMGYHLLSVFMLLLTLRLVVNVDKRESYRY